MFGLQPVLGWINGVGKAKRAPGWSGESSTRIGWRPGGTSAALESGSVYTEHKRVDKPVKNVCVGWFFWMDPRCQSSVWRTSGHPQTSPQFGAGLGDFGRQDRSGQIWGPSLDGQMCPDRPEICR